MNLAEKIHELWAATPALTDLVEADHVFTGIASDPALPFVVVAFESQSPTSRHNDGSGIDEVAVRFTAYDQERDDAEAIAVAIRTAFDRADFALSGDDAVIAMMAAGVSESPGLDGVWSFTVSFIARVHLEAGV